MAPLWLATAGWPVAAQIDQVYDVEPPVYEAAELDSVAIDTNAETWPGHSRFFSSPVDFDRDDDLVPGNMAPDPRTPLLYEGQPLSDVYGQDWEFAPRQESEDDRYP